jgi:hypothetical protein
MKILLEISSEHYDRLLSGVSEKSLLYGILKDGVVIHPTKAGAGSRMIEILCESFTPECFAPLRKIFPRKPCLRLKRQSDFLACTTNPEQLGIFMLRGKTTTLYRSTDELPVSWVQNVQAVQAVQNVWNDLNYLNFGTLMSRSPLPSIRRVRPLIVTCQ